LLTDAERRVAALAAVGYANREIAGKLFVTLSTVEQHLTRIYRKLKVTSRADLPSSLDLGRPVEV
jgi:DNA-binding CsgD family transcriptional regulator